MFPETFFTGSLKVTTMLDFGRILVRIRQVFEPLSYILVGRHADQQGVAILRAAASRLGFGLCPPGTNVDHEKSRARTPIAFFEVDLNSVRCRKHVDGIRQSRDDQGVAGLRVVACLCRNAAAIQVHPHGAAAADFRAPAVHGDAQFSDLTMRDFTDAPTLERRQKVGKRKGNLERFLRLGTHGE